MTEQSGDFKAMDDQNKRKNKQVKFWLDDDEYGQLMYAVKNAGTTRVEYFRNLLYHGSAERHTNYSAEDAKNLLAELCDISNAMSQIAYNARLKCLIDESEYLQLESSFKSLVEAFVEHVIN